MIKFKVGPLFRRNLQTRKNIVIHVGGTRAGKTFSVLLYFWYLSMTVKNLKFLVCRKTGPALRITVYKDFQDILRETQTGTLYHWDKTEKSFTNLATNSFILFTAIDEIEKIKGGQFNYIFMNEANQFDEKEFQILKMRLSARREDNRPNQIILDLNPSDYYGWVREYIEKNIAEIDLIESNYQTNPFLGEDYIRMILELKNQDEHLWRIYGLGKWDKPENIVYNKWEIIEDKDFDELNDYEWESYGLDFGYNSPVALVHIKVKKDDIYVRELIYQTKLLINDIADLMEGMGVSKEIIVYADPSSPESIRYLQERGFWVEAGDRNVKDGIKRLQMCKIWITKSSVNLIDEIKNYSFQKKDDKVLDEPVKWKDHALDALRYAYYTFITKGLKEFLW